MATNDPNSPYGTVPVSDATDMTANWRTFLAAHNPDFNVRSYNVPMMSLQNLVANNPDAEAIRIYIGLQDTDDITTTKLLFIPIVDGKEVPYQQVAAGNGLTGCDSDDCSNIYNLTEPCPPYCTTGNPPGDFTLDS